MPQLPISGVTVTLTGVEREAVQEAIATELEIANDCLVGGDSDEDAAVRDHRDALMRADQLIQNATPDRITIKDVLEPWLDGIVSGIPFDEDETQIDEAWRLQRLIWRVEAGSASHNPDTLTALADACWEAWEGTMGDHEYEPANLRAAADALEAWRFWVDRLNGAFCVEWRHQTVR